MGGFVVPTCACGHSEGDHRAVANGLHVQSGVCLVKGCECRAFADVRWAYPSNPGERAA